MLYSFLGSFLGGKKSLENYIYFFTSRYFNDLIFTMFIGLATATLSFFISIPIAISLRKGFKGKTLVQGLLMFPIVVPELIAGYALWLTLLPNGLLSNISKLVLGAGLPLIPSWIKLVIACIWKYFPMMTLMVTAGLEGIDPDLELAARGLGASSITTFVRITLPLLIPSLIAGYTLVLLRAAGQFSITLVIGGARLTTIPIDVWYKYQLAEIDFAYTLSTVFTLVMIVIVLIFTKMLRGIYHGY